MIMCAKTGSHGPMYDVSWQPDMLTLPGQRVFVTVLSDQENRKKNGRR